MYPATSNKELATRRLLLCVNLLLIAAIAAVASLAVHTRSQTGELDITAFAESAGISIGRNNKTAEFVGTGTAHLRLPAGNYQIVAANNGATGTAVVTVQTGVTAAVKISQAAKPVIPSPDDISFTGLQTLIDNGLTSTQVANLRNLFFMYKKTADAVSIDPNSVEPGPHNPASADPTLRLNFSGTIDGVPYKAMASYTDLTNIQLTLYNTAGTQLFSQNSASISS